MSFFSEIAVKIGLNELSLSGGYNVINYSGKAVYIEGIKRLLKVENEEILLELSGAILTVKGETLAISEFSEAVIIKGKITSLYFAEFKNKLKGNRDEERRKNKK